MAGKKVGKAAPKSKVVKAKPVAKAKPVTAKPASKVVVKKSEVKALVIAPLARKVRGPNKLKAKGSYADLLKKQAELEEIKKDAKAELKKEYDNLLKDADKIKAQYKELFSESIDSAPKARGTRGAKAKKVSGKIPGLKPFTIKEVEDFVDQKKEGVAIKIKGRRPKSIARMEEAFRHSEDAEDILKELNQ